MKARTSPKCCIFYWMRFVMFFAIFVLRYRVWEVAVLTLVCDITPYILLVCDAEQMPPFGHYKSRVRTELCIIVLRKSTDFEP